MESKQANKKRGGGKLASALKNDSNSDKSSSSSGLTRDILDTSDRELARLFVEMFQPLGGQHISVVFHDSNLVEAAKLGWNKDPSAQCQIQSLNRGKVKKALVMKDKKGMGMGGKGMSKKSKKKAFATKMNEEFDDETSGPFKLPQDCELAIFIAPTVKDLVTIKRICNDVGMGTLVVLLNARLSLIDKQSFGSEDNEEFFKEEFESIFYLSVAPQEAAPGCLMHRAYPNDWIVARKPKAGSPKTISTFEEKPTQEECAQAYDSIEISDIEKAAEGVLDNVSSWLK